MISKYIVFDLPSGAGGMAAAIYNSQTLKKIRLFSEQYKIHYKSKTQKNTLRVWFEREEDYTLFFLVFDIASQWSRPRLENGTYEET